MFKTFLLTLCANLSLVACELPEMIDFSQYKSLDDGYYASFNQEAFNNGYYAFNYAPELTPFFALLKNKYHIENAIETGTFYGGTTLIFGLLFDHTYTIEIKEKTHARAKKNLASFPNITCLLGNSVPVLEDLLPSLKGKRLLFYLDAHWDNKNFPLYQELSVIGQTHRDSCIIVIDDFKVEGRPDIHYDRYSGGACTLDRIQSDLDKVFSEYSIHYLIPKSTRSRAKLIVIPKNWAF